MDLLKFVESNDETAQLMLSLHSRFEGMQKTAKKKKTNTKNTEKANQRLKEAEEKGAKKTKKRSLGYTGTKGVRTICDIFA